MRLPWQAGEGREERPCEALPLSSRSTGKRARHPVGIARNDLEICPRRLVRLGSPLLPIAQRTERNMVACREFLLCQPERPPQRLHARHTPRLCQFFRRHRPCVRIGHGGSVDFLLRHRPHRCLRQRPLGSVVKYFNSGSVRTNSRDSSCLAHVALPGGLKSLVCALRGPCRSRAEGRHRTCQAH